MWGPYQRSWHRLKEATRPSRMASGDRAGDEIGPVTLHAKGRRNRAEKGFDAAVAAYVATMVVGCGSAALAHRTRASMVPVFLIVTALTAAAGSAFILASRSPWRARLVAGLPLAAIAVFLGAIGLGFAPWQFR